MPSTAHNHLDSMRRERGTGCPACDEAWAAQEERVRALRPGMKADRSIQQLVDKGVELNERTKNPPG